MSQPMSVHKQIAEKLESRWPKWIWLESRRNEFVEIIEAALMARIVQLKTTDNAIASEAR